MQICILKIYRIQKIFVLKFVYKILYLYFNGKFFCMNYIFCSREHLMKKKYIKIYIFYKLTHSFQKIFIVFQSDYLWMNYLSILCDLLDETQRSISVAVHPFVTIYPWAIYIVLVKFLRILVVLAGEVRALCAQVFAYYVRCEFICVYAYRQLGNHSQSLFSFVALCHDVMRLLFSSYQRFCIICTS